MSIGGLSHGLAGGRVPLWSIAAAALLVTAGFGKRPYTAPRPAGTTGGAPEDGRGRSAAKPSDIPIPGWRDIVLRVYEGVSHDRILANAAAVTYYALLALFPGIAALVSIYGLFADPNTLASHLDVVAGVAPSGAIDVIRGQLSHLSARGSTTLGVSFAIGLAISLWSANSGTK